MSHKFNLLTLSPPMSRPDTFPCATFETAFLGTHILGHVRVDPQTLRGDVRFSYKRMPMCLSNESWFMRDFHRLFFLHLKAQDPERFGKYDKETGEFEMTSKQRQACVAQGLIDVLVCVNKIFGVHPGLIGYAQWYLEERRRETMWNSVNGLTYSQYITQKACEFIMQELLVPATPTQWDIVEF